MPASSYRLYARQGAGSLAPQMLLEEIGAAYELVWVSKAAAEIEAFRRVSPAAKIPVLGLPDGTVVSVLADDRALLEIASDAFCEALGTGIHISMSTVSPVTSRVLAERHARPA